MNSRCISRLLCVVLVLGLVLGSVTCGAEEVTTAGNTSEIPVVVDAEAAVFNVTVPTSFPVSVDSSGKTTVGTNAVITNNSVAPVRVTDIEVEPASGWSLCDWVSWDPTLVSVDAPEFCMHVNQVQSEDDSFEFTSDCFPHIYGGDELPVFYNICLSARSEVMYAETIANVCITVDWDTMELAPGLYDETGVLLCTWEESGIDIEADYTFSTADTDPASPKYVLENLYPTARLMVLPETVTRLGNYTLYLNQTITGLICKASSMEYGIACLTFACLNYLEIPSDLTSYSMVAFGVNSSCLFVIRGSENFVVREGVLYRLGDAVVELVQYPVFKPGSELEIPLDVTALGSGCCAFSEYVEHVVLPAGIDEISSLSFYGCVGLKTVYIPASVTTISDSAFAYDISLDTIYYEGSEAEWNAITKSADWDNNTGDYTIVYNYVLGS